MPTCPRCHQAVEAHAVSCPYCRTTLKAHGHPGIPLYRASGNAYLCDTCTYHEDDTCNFPQRPYARECTLYRNHLQPTTTPVYTPNWQTSIGLWVKRNAVWLIFLGLIVISVLLVL